MDEKLNLLDQIQRPMMEVVTNSGHELRAIDHFDVSPYCLFGRERYHVERVQPELRDNEQAFHCLDGTVYIVHGLP